MEKKFNYFENPIRQKVFQLTGVVLRLFGFVIVGALLSQVLLSIFIGINLTDSEQMMVEMQDGQDSKTVLLLMQALNAIFVYFALPLIYIYIFQKDLKRIFSIRKEKLGIFMLLSFFIFLAALPFISQLIEFNKQIRLPERLSELQQEVFRMEEHAEKVTQLIVFYDSWYEIIPILFVIAVLAGIGEELLFRGIIQNEITSILKNPHLAIWISAILFSFIHFQFQGFLPRMALGALFGYLYYWSGSLVVPMFIHFINNVFVFAQVNYTRLHGETHENIIASPLLALIATMICVILIVACCRISINLNKERLAP